MRRGIEAARLRRRAWLVVVAGLLVLPAACFDVDSLRHTLTEASQEASEEGRWADAATALLALARVEAFPSALEEPLARALDRDVVVVPAGRYPIGRPDGGPLERPRRRVFLDRYAIDRHEVTNAQYRRFVLSTDAAPPRYWDGDHHPEGRGADPVVGVSWSQACAYCEWVGKRLPTEAEWEVACAGPDGLTYPWGETWRPDGGDVGWSGDLNEAWSLLRSPHDEGRGPAAVGGHPEASSPFGVADMVGGASEWTLDWFTFSGYEDVRERNPVGLGPEIDHSVRGSAWLDPHGPSHTRDASRCQFRNSSHSFDDPRIGFRCAEGPGQRLSPSSSPNR